MQKGHGEKSSKIKDGGQEMAVMVRLITKISIMTIQVNLVPISSFSPCPFCMGMHLFTARLFLYRYM